MEIKLSPHFTLDEFVRTSRVKFEEQNRLYGIKNINKLRELAYYMEEVRALLQSPIIVTSGVRCPELNKAVGGSVNSQHMKCEAIDFVPSRGGSVQDAFCKIFNSTLSFDQLILEESKGKIWLHISDVGLKNRREALYYNGKKYTKYTG